MGQAIDGKTVATNLRRRVATAAADFAARVGRPVGLHVILVGDDPASQVYVRNKARACEEAGMRGEIHRLPATTPQRELIERVQTLGARDDVDGILVQLPLPAPLDETAVLHAIDPRKDVDGFHPLNAGALLTGTPGLLPCTPLGCIRLLDHVGIPLEGARAVVLGRSNIVGKPMALLLLRRHATVTIAHSRTRDLPRLCAEADVLVAAVGRAGMIRGTWIKPGATVIDVGINRRDDGQLVGDVAFEEALERAAWVTPVPGGVGPMTIACLLENTVRAAWQRCALPPAALAL